MNSSAKDKREQHQQLQAAAKSESRTKKPTLQFEDNRPETVQQKSLGHIANSSTRVSQLQELQQQSIKNRVSPKADTLIQRKVEKDVLQMIRCEDCGKSQSKCQCEPEETGPKSAHEWWEQDLNDTERQDILRSLGTHEAKGGANTSDKTTGGSKKGDSHGNSAGEAKSTVFNIYKQDPGHWSNPKNWNDKNRVKKAKGNI